MIAEKGPRPGTNTAVVLELLRGGKTHPKIAAETGLSPTQITSAKAQIYKLGYRPRPTREEKTRGWKASHPGYPLSRQHRDKLRKALKGREVSQDTRRLLSSAQGGIWAAIEKYAQMRMSPAEVREAVRIEGGPAFSSKQITRALGKARRRGELARLTPAEKLKTIGDRFRPKEEIQRQVKPYVAIKESMDAQNLEIDEVFSSIFVTIKKFMDTQNLEMTEVFGLISEISGWLDQTQPELPRDPVTQLALGLFLYARRQNSLGNSKPLAQFLPITATLGERWEMLRPYALNIVDATPANPRTNHGQVQNAMAVHGEVSLGELDGR